ncbi:LysR family transcriptional regulator [Agarivorans sp. Alg241-V36]|uniref:LysR family transcriptional regulator n=1 Tax=Agarivorans sp. Alg241-V36 TaxID=2305992 RepID=UPI0013D2973B|nr:LysR family transcriptional regulator [Agarivorans sp. Alg241-V36]
MINLEHMVIFVASAEEGSFSAAARALKKSISSVSMCISNLEDELNVQLFDRSRKHPTLTPAGERLLTHAQTILRQARRLDSVVQDVNDSVEESFAIGIGELVPMGLVEERIAKTIRQYPNTKFKIERGRRDELQEKFESGQLQVLLRSQSAGVDTEADFYQFDVVDMVCVCSPDSALADLELVDNESLIATRQIICESMYENPMLQIEATLSNDIMLVSSISDMIQLVEQDIGWAFIPQVEAEERMKFGGLTIFKPEFAITSRGIALDFLIKPSHELGPVAHYLKAQFTHAS